MEEELVVCVASWIKLSDETAGENSKGNSIARGRGCGCGGGQERVELWWLKGGIERQMWCSEGG
jgi:hypothetical protein